jgi:hypothetical protein
MSIRNDKQYFIDFQAFLEILLIIPDTHFKR